MENAMEDREDYRNKPLEQHLKEFFKEYQEHVTTEGEILANEEIAGNILAFLTGYFEGPFLTALLADVFMLISEEHETGCEKGCPYHSLYKEWSHALGVLSAGMHVTEA